MWQTWTRRIRCCSSPSAQAPVGGVFHLAMILHDRFLTNQVGWSLSMKLICCMVANSFCPSNEHPSTWCTALWHVHFAMAGCRDLHKTVL